MSRFETSTFVRNNGYMDSDLLKKACEELNWSYTFQNNELLVYDLGNGIDFNGEYAIKLSNTNVMYNTYYFGDTAIEVDRLQSKFNELNVSYTETLILRAFKEKGFTFKRNIKFKETTDERISFYMVGRSKEKSESEPVGEIKFTILRDGTLVSDSNYLPDDVNKRAHSAMDSIDLFFDSPRKMTKKKIPQKYRGRVTHSKIIQRIK
jgi:hypothetical protein